MAITRLRAHLLLCHLTGQTKYLSEIISIVNADIIISRRPLASVLSHMSIFASFRENLDKLCWRHFLGKQFVFVKDSSTLSCYSTEENTGGGSEGTKDIRIFSTVLSVTFWPCFRFELTWRMTSSKSRFTHVISVRTCRSVSAKLYINCWLILASLPLQLHPFCLFLRCFRFEFTWKIWLVPCLGLSFPSEYSQACQPSCKFSCWLILASLGYVVLFLLLKTWKLNERKSKHQHSNKSFTRWLASVPSRWSNQVSFWDYLDN